MKRTTIFLLALFSIMAAYGTAPAIRPLAITDTLKVGPEVISFRLPETSIIAINDNLVGDGLWIAAVEERVKDVTPADIQHIYRNEPVSNNIEIIFSFPRQNGRHRNILISKSNKYLTYDDEIPSKTRVQYVKATPVRNPMKTDTFNEDGPLFSIIYTTTGELKDLSISWHEAGTVD